MVATISFHLAVERASHQARGVAMISSQTVEIAASRSVSSTGGQSEASEIMEAYLSE